LKASIKLSWPTNIPIDLLLREEAHASSHFFMHLAE